MLSSNHRKSIKTGEQKKKKRKSDDEEVEERKNKPEFDDFPFCTYFLAKSLW